MNDDPNGDWQHCVVKRSTSDRLEPFTLTNRQQTFGQIVRKLEEQFFNMFCQVEVISNAYRIEYVVVYNAHINVNPVGGETRTV
jgi:hypothetical protein